MRLLTKQSREESRNSQIKYLKENHSASVFSVYNIIIVKYETNISGTIRPMVKIWRENAANPYVNYYFQNEEKRQAYIDQEISKAESYICRKARRSIERKNSEDTRQKETIMIKKALKEYGINAKVNHGKGTAWGWLEINIGSGQQFGEHEIDETYHSHAHCERCRKNHLIHDFVLTKVSDLTGRTGEYNGRILILSQDAWSDKKGSIVIEHDLEKLYESIPELNNND